MTAKRKQRPWFKFWHKEWLVDPELRICSPEARGVWIDLICVMANSTEPGVLLVAGRVPDMGEISRLTGIPDKRKVARIIKELEHNRVLSRNSDGAILSRKMREMYADWVQSCANGVQGGNPNLLNNNILHQNRDNPPLGFGDNIEEEKKNPEEERTSPLRGEAPPEASRDSDGAGDLFGEKAPPAPPPPAAALNPDDPRVILFRWGLPVLIEATKRPEKRVRSWMGLMLKGLHDDAGALLAVIQEAERLRPASPEAWISAAVRDRAKPTSAAKPEAFAHVAETPESLFLKRYLDGEIDREGNEIQGTAPPEAEFAGTTIDGVVE
jgi:hypothetical protein